MIGRKGFISLLVFAFILKYRIVCDHNLLCTMHTMLYSEACTRQSVGCVASRYAVLHHAMLCCIMLCCVASRYAVLHHDMLCCIMLCCVASRYAVLHHDMLCCIMLCCVASCYAVFHHAMLCCILFFLKLNCKVVNPLFAVMDKW